MRMALIQIAISEDVEQNWRKAVSLFAQRLLTRAIAKKRMGFSNCAD